MSDERPSNLPLYRSDLSGEPLTLRGLRLAILAPGEIPVRPAFRGRVVPADLADVGDRTAIDAINNFYWGSLEQDIFGKTYKILECENILARPLPGELGADEPSIRGIAGHVALSEEDGFLHIVVFHVWPSWHGRGVGRKMLNTAIGEAVRRGLGSVKLGTTNDNLPALYFYQRAGFVVEEVLPGEAAGSHGGAAAGFAGIPVRDEIRLRLDLQG